jgi:hypothetical protein
MIPSEITDLLKGVMVGHVGTRDSKLQGSEVFSMWFSTNGQEQMTVFISEALSGKALTNISDNKKIAVAYTAPLSHSSYQLKGTYLSHRNANDQEHKDIKEAVDRFYTGYLSMFGYPPEIVSTFKFAPAIAITFTIEDTFIQTPGPNAGQKMNTK